MKKRFLIAPILLTFLLGGCNVSNNYTSGDPSVDPSITASVDVDADMFKPADTKIVDSFDCVITLSGTSATFSTTFGGLQLVDGVITISTPGSYQITGSSSNISIIVNDSNKVDNIFLVLNNVTMTHSNKACILVQSASKVIIQSQSGSVNSLTGTNTSYTYQGTNIDATVYSHDTITFNGTGTLTVTSNYLKAVESKDDIRIYDAGKFTFIATKDKGLNINDSLRIGGSANVNITSGEDGVHVENSSGDSFFYMESGSLTIKSGYDGIDVSTSGNSFTGETTGKYGIKVVKGTLNITTTASYSTNTSSKALKCAGNILLGNVNASLTGNDDGMHSDKSITITGGNYAISSGDDAIHADNTLQITGGTINISKSSEGVETNHFYLIGGSLTINASDDGINASKKINETPTVNVSGGRLDIFVAGNNVDGIDSNGNFTQTGGTVITRCPANNTGGTNTALDVDGTATINGGNFIALGPLEGNFSVGSSVYGFQDGTVTGDNGGGPGGGGFRAPGGSSSQSVILTSGTWTVSGIDVSFDLTGNYYGVSVYSSNFTKGNTYTISDGSTTKSYTAS